jgi:2-iminobutanoate/2-iminopropanoate deaminase
MNFEIAPSGIAPTAANYAHAILSVGPARLLHTSGIVPIAADGSVPADLAEQAATVWSNLRAILEQAEMNEPLAPVMAARDAALGGHRAASTLVTVPALARPDWRMEIALVAAR